MKNKKIAQKKINSLRDFFISSLKSQISNLRNTSFNKCS